MNIPTLLEIWSDYKLNRELKINTKNEYEGVLRRCFGAWLYLPADRITSKMVLARHFELSNQFGPRGRGTAQADLACRILRSLYKFACLYYEDQNGESVVKANPVDKLSGLKRWNGCNRREDRIPVHLLPRFWSELQKMTDTTARDWMVLLLLTGLRRSEAACLKWQNVCFESRTFTLVDTKNGKDHVVPMTTYLYEMFKARKSSPAGLSNYVFPGNLTGTCLTKWDRSYEPIADAIGYKFSPHSLRRGFMSTATELGIHIYQIKAMMNHSNKTDVTFGYYVADINKLRAAFQQVADELIRQAHDDHERPIVLAS